MKRLALVFVLCAAAPLHAETFVGRSKAVVGSFANKAMTAPENVFHNRLTTAFVYMYPSQWQQLLTDRGLAVNPNNPDVLDVGTLDENQTFTPASAAVKRRLASQHHLRMVRSWHAEILRAYALKYDPVAPSDAGKSIETIATEKAAAVRTEAKSELGDNAADLLDEGETP